ncbi:hypothetical protein VTJ83DRAFT_5196 [Remersonia thermophila]|uniref:C2H2-type domain-containing protein n=1 Tax=Remersonia thermophila TaxID=72144 RepID=A0ABR4DD36_9PEZI
MAGHSEPIFAAASQTRRLLRELRGDAADKAQRGALPHGVEVDPIYLTDCLDRFNLWGGSLGVFQKGDASLDARLSNHVVAREVLRLLKQLDAVVSDLREIIDGKREQSTWTRASLLHMAAEDFSDVSSCSDDEPDVVCTPESNLEDGQASDLNDVMTESKDLHFSINEAVASLLRLSAQVRKSSRKAKFAKSSVDENYAVGPDISHIREFFPHLDASRNVALAERLGKANAQRRQWLLYRRRHHQKLSIDLSEPVTQPMESSSRNSRGWPEEEDDTKSIAQVSALQRSPTWNSSLISPTRASTFVSRDPGAEDTLFPRLGGLAETLYARSSKAPVDEQRLLVPKPPQDLVLGQPYFCRYCCSVVEISGRQAWQKHVHSDLSSYVCLAEHCDLFFESRRKWWAHEMESHRKTWTCGICNHSRVSDIASMKAHIRTSHADQVREDQVDDVADKFGRPVSHFDAAECPFCDYPCLLRQRGISEHEISRLSIDKFGRHLARHQEQLSLFVLPNSDVADADESDGESRCGMESDWDASESEVEQPPTVQDPELLRAKLAEIVKSQKSMYAESLPSHPDLALRWQPPQDFTPPLEDFDTDDPDRLPLRQEPIFGGDLHTPGWARGTGSRKEGFCARCPVSHWVNMADGSYAFHLTYFHGVPESGVPLPRPPMLRTSSHKHGWEAFCESCNGWRVLKKTPRGWNWYRHWLNDHSEIVQLRTEAVRNSDDERRVFDLQHATIEPPSTPLEDTRQQTHTILEGILLAHSDQVNCKQVSSLLAVYAAHDMDGLFYDFLSRAAQRWPPHILREIVNAATESGLTLLQMAAAQGLTWSVISLLEWGADPNVAGQGHPTPLDLAADAGYFFIAQRLVTGGADVAKAPLFARIISNEREYAGENTSPRTDCQGANSSSPSRIDVKSLGPLGRAAFAGDIAIVKSLLGKGDSPAVDGGGTGGKSGNRPDAAGGGGKS